MAYIAQLYALSVRISCNASYPEACSLPPTRQLLLHTDLSCHLATRPSAVCLIRAPTPTMTTAAYPSMRVKALLDALEAERLTCKHREVYPHPHS